MDNLIYNIKLEGVNYQLEIEIGWLDDLFSIGLTRLSEGLHLTRTKGRVNMWVTGTNGEWNGNNLEVPDDFRQACSLWLKSGGFAGLDLVDYLRGVGLQIERI